jgi:hypothetical protein
VQRATHTGLSTIAIAFATTNLLSHISFAPRWVYIRPEPALTGACHISQILIDRDFEGFHAKAWNLSIVLQKEEQLMPLSISVVSAFKLQLRFCKS